MTGSRRPAALDEPIVAWKRAQVLLRPDGSEVRFAGTVRSEHPYRADDVFRCPRGHRRLEPLCSCGFYAFGEPHALPHSVVRTAVVEVDMEGLIVLHRTYLRAERQRIRVITFEGWCSYCTGVAAVVAGVRPTWAQLPEPWLRGVPVCVEHQRLFEVVTTDEDLAQATEAEVRWDRASESHASRSLRRLYHAAKGALP